MCKKYTYSCVTMLYFNKEETMKKLIIITFLYCLPQIIFASNQDASAVYEWITKLQGEWKLADKQEGKATQHKLVKPIMGTETTAMAFKTIGKGSTIQEDLLSSTKTHGYHVPL